MNSTHSISSGTAPIILERLGFTDDTEELAPLKDYMVGKPLPSMQVSDGATAERIGQIFHDYLERHYEDVPTTCKPLNASEFNEARTQLTRRARPGYSAYSEWLRPHLCLPHCTPLRSALARYLTTTNHILIPPSPKKELPQTELPKLELKPETGFFMSKDTLALNKLSNTSLLELRETLASQNVYATAHNESSSMLYQTRHAVALTTLSLLLPAFLQEHCGDKFSYIQANHKIFQESNADPLKLLDAVAKTLETLHKAREDEVVKFMENEGYTELTPDYENLKQYRL